MEGNGTKGPPRRRVELGAFVVGIAHDAAGGTVAAATGAGKVVLLPADPLAQDAPRDVDVHRGASLAFCRGPSGTDFLSGGDDGRLVRGAGSMASSPMRGARWSPRRPASSSIS
jgi:hypothetical protein